MGQRSLDFEEQFGIPIVPFSTAEAVTPDQARSIADALKSQADVYCRAAHKAEVWSAKIASFDYESHPSIRVDDRPYDQIFKPLRVIVRGYQETEED
jgi:hypothetical protein